MEPVEVKDMLYILGVCEERSFSGSGKVLYFAAGAQQNYKTGRGNLGAQIFDRSSVPLKVTPEGKYLSTTSGRCRRFIWR